MWEAGGTRGGLVGDTGAASERQAGDIFRILINFIFWLCWVFVTQTFSSYGEWGLLPSCSARLSHGCGFLLQSLGSRARGLQ